MKKLIIPILLLFVLSCQAQEKDLHGYTEDALKRTIDSVKAYTIDSVKNHYIYIIHNKDFQINDLIIENGLNRDSLLDMRSIFTGSDLNFVLESDTANIIIKGKYKTTLQIEGTKTYFTQENDTSTLINLNIKPNSVQLYEVRQ